MEVTLLRLRLIFILLLVVSASSAQTILGYVYDGAKGVPLEGASVYLDGTTYGVISDQEGKFVIATDRKVKADLIISYIGYTSVREGDPYRGEVLEVVLQETQATLEAVTVRTGKEYWSRAKMLREFKKQFLGPGRPGELCRIENEEDIDLWFQPENETLKATADVPIRIQNNFLGYSIEYNLSEFEAKYDAPERKDPYCRFVYYEGSSFYSDMASSPAMKEIFRLQRGNSYDGSVQHFFRSMIADDLRGQGYSIYIDDLEISPGRVYTIEQMEDHFLVYFKRNFILNYQKKLTSRVVVKDQKLPIKVYPDGNYEPARRIRFDGDLGFYRLAKTLPLNYRSTDQSR